MIDLRLNIITNDEGEWQHVGYDSRRSGKRESLTVSTIEDSNHGDRLWIHGFQVDGKFMDIDVYFNGEVRVRRGQTVIYDFDPELIREWLHAEIADRASVPLDINDLDADAEYDKKRDDELTEVEV